MKDFFYICILFSTSIALEKKEFVIDGKVSLEGLWAEFEELFEPGAPGSLRPGLYACSGWCRWVTILKGPKFPCDCTWKNREGNIKFAKFLRELASAIHSFYHFEPFEESSTSPPEDWRFNLRPLIFSITHFSQCAMETCQKYWLKPYFNKFSSNPGKSYETAGKPLYPIGTTCSACPTTTAPCIAVTGLCVVKTTSG
ncbi:unnamed protein product, partial [Mesorhabditis belari]|uniref:Uncharacterized protein n=1 Tax=Mesorhabditis belari TaxID=2138241 RepID=A0AAF3EZV4_9BILA